MWCVDDCGWLAGQGRVAVCVQCCSPPFIYIHCPRGAAHCTILINLCEVHHATTTTGTLTGHIAIAALSSHLLFVREHTAASVDAVAVEGRLVAVSLSPVMHQHHNTLIVCVCSSCAVVGVLCTPPLPHRMCSARCRQTGKQTGRFLHCLSAPPAAAAAAFSAACMASGHE